MNKNKGYYSWIHSLKNAAMQSQQKGFEMLREQREEGGDEKLKQEFLARKMATGRDTEQGGQNKKKDVKPAGNANAVANDAMDGVMGDEGHEGLELISRLPGTKLPDIQAGTFPPPSSTQPAAQYTKSEAEEAVRRFNRERQGEMPVVNQEDSERAELVRIAKEAMVAAARKGKNEDQQREAGRTALRARLNQIMPQEPERTTEVVTPEGHRMHLPMESVSQKIDRLLREEKATRPGPITDTAIGSGFPRGMLGLIKGPKTDKAIMSLMVDMVDNPENYDPNHVRHAHETLQTIAKFMNQTEED